MKKYYVILIVFMLGFVGLTAQNTLLLEDFESGFPASWTTNAPGTSAWAVGDNLGSSGFVIPAHTNYAVSNDNSCNCDLSQDSLFTDYIDFTGLSGVKLRFDAFLPSPYTQYGFNDSKGYIYASANGTTWQLVYTVPIDAAWQSYVIDLDGIVSGQMKFAFVHDDQGSYATGFAIDNVHFYSQFANDLAVVSLDSPVSGCLSSSENVQVTLSNEGINAITTFDISYSIDGSTIVTDQVTGVNIASGATYVHTFSIAASLIEANSYAFNVALSSDDNTNNNTLVSDVNVDYYGSLPVPYTEDFTGDDSYYWSLQENVGSQAQFMNGMVVMNGVGYANWVGGINSTTEDNAWNDNTEFHSSLLLTCNANKVPANTENLELLLDLRQETQLALDYSWFAVYVNSTRVSDINGQDSFNPATPGGDAWTTLTYNLTPFNNGSDIEIELRSCNHYAADKVYIDNVIVRQRNEADAGVVNVISPVSDCGLSAANDLTVIIENFGVEPINNIPVYFQVDGGGSYLAGLVNATIQPGAQSAPVTFSGLTMSGLENVGVHTLNVYTQLNGDIYHPENDALAVQVIHLPLISSFPYEQDFEGTSYWTSDGTNNSWELGVPSGQSITPDPNGNNCWVTNAAGNYNNNEVSYIQSPCFDFSAVTDPYIEFDIWYETDANTDGVQLQSSVNGGPWTVVGTITIPNSNNWYNNAVTAFGSGEEGWTNDSQGWLKATQSLTGFVGNSQVSFRFVFASDGDNLGGNPQTEQNYDGVAIDNIFVGEPQANWDLKAVDWLTPVTGTSLGSAETVSISVENLGLNDITSFDAKYSIDGGSNYTTPETFNVSILSGASATITFTTPADFSSWGTYNVEAVVILANDENATNDMISASIQSIPVITSYPYNQDFQNSNHFWEVGGSNISWQYGIPQGTTIPVDPTDIPTDLAWVTNLDGNYNNNEFSWVESPVFDFTSLIQPWISMRIAYDAEGNTPDGSNLQYTLDGGTTWNTIGDVAAPPNTNNWYINYIDGLGGEAGWTTISSGWKTAMHDLSALAGESNVKLRVLFGSDASQTYEGMAFDDVMIYENAPHDLTITEWSSQSIACGLGAAEIVTVKIQNDGFFTESFFDVTYSIDFGGNISSATETVTQSVDAGQFISYSFVSTADFSIPGIYNCTATVALATDDVTGNDSFTQQVIASPSISIFPYMQDFENGDGDWLALGTSSSWALGAPAGTVINAAASGSNAWVTNLGGEYNMLENSWVESPCFNFALLDTPAIQFSYISDIEFFSSTFAFDGAILEYSLDGGAAWTRVGNYGDTANWYNYANVWSLNHADGWSGSVPNWVITGIRIPELGGETNVKLRFRFASDDYNNDFREGFGFDNILVYNDVNFAGDAGIVDISLSNDCEFTNDHYVNVTIQNFHADSTMYAGDVINLAYTFDGGAPVVETHILANDILPGQTYVYQFALPVNYGAASTYNVTAYTLLVNDLDGSNDSWSETVTVYPTPLIDVVLASDVLCNGENTGSIDLASNVNLSYLWNDNSTGEDLLNVVAGSYSVTVTDNNQCTNTQSFTIVEPDALTLNLAVVHNNCYDDVTGQITATVTGGVAPYVYLWSNNEPTSVISGLASGSYSLVVTDANNCTISGSEIVNPEGPFTASVAVTNPISCNGVADGEITVNVSGGNSPYIFDWDNSTETTQSLTGLSSGDYSVVVTDQNGCTAGSTSSGTTYTFNNPITGSSHTIFVPGTLVLNVDGTPVTPAVGNEYKLGVFYDDGGTLVCGGYYTFDGNQGAVSAAGYDNLSGIGFQTGEAFTWIIETPAGAALMATATYMPPSPPFLTDAGNFIDGGLSGITQLDAVTPPSSGNLIGITLSEPDILSVSFSATEYNNYNITCNGASDGGIVALASGGTTPYNYQWDNGPNSQSNQNLPSGTYSVVVSDDHSCSVTDAFTLTEPDALALTYTLQNVDCNGASTGEIDITVTGGVTPYSYVWSNSETNGDLLNVPVGSYTVTVTDANNCTLTETMTLSEPSLLPIVQDFELLSLPSGWTQSQDANSYGWEFGTDLSSTFFTIPVHSGYAAANDDAHDDFTGSQNLATVDYLISPLFDLSNYASANVTFDAFFNDQFTGIATLEISVDGGTSWNVLYTVSPQSAWQEDINVSLDSYLGNCGVLLAWHFNDEGLWASGFAIDNVNISGAWQYDDDMVLVDWIAPTAYSCNLSVSEAITVQIKNEGLNAATGFTIDYTVNGTTIAPETYTGTINPNDIVNYTFTTLADLSAAGTYTFSANITFAADGDNTNNSISGITVYHYPTISSFPYLEDFEDNLYDDFNLTSGAQASAMIGNDGTDNALYAQGGDPSIGWFGGINATPTNAWVDNYEHHVSLGTWCSVDASTLGTLELLFDLNQGFTNEPLNNWFRVLVNGTQVSADYNPTSQAGSYQTITIDLDAYAGTTFDLEFQFSIRSYYDHSWLDNIILREKSMDVAANTIVTPVSDCQLGVETVEVELENLGGLAATGFPIDLLVDGSVVATETVSASIAPGTTYNYTFTATADLSSNGSHTVGAVVAVPADANNSNDSVSVSLLSTPYYNTYPFVESSANFGQYWVTGGTNSSWEFDTDTWYTSFSGNYNNDEVSYVMSPCFDFTSLVNPYIEFNLNYNAEYNVDGLVLQYTTDGSTWNTLGASGDNYNWYNGPSNWTGNSGQFITVRHSLLSLAGMSGIKFRMFFTSDASTVADGVAFNSVSIYEMPDVGVVAIGPSPVCAGSDFSVNVDVMNYSAAMLPTGTQINVSYILDGGASVAEVFTLSSDLASNASSSFVFSATENISVNGLYAIEATAGTDGDYNSSNNTFGANIEILALPVVDAGSDTEMCIGDAAGVTLTATGATTYLWDDPLNSVTASVTVFPVQTTTYTVVGTDGNQCSSSDQVTVVVNPLPNADAGSDQTVCFGDQVTLTATGGTQYQWDDASSTATAELVFTASADVTYTVTVSDANGCSASDAVNVFVNALPVTSISNDVSICEGESTTLSATGGDSYLWNFGQTDASISVDTLLLTTTYYVTITDNTTGCSNVENVTVSVTNGPQVNNVAIVDNNCFGGSEGSISLTYTAVDPVTVLWSNNGTSDAITNLMAGDYTVTITDATGPVCAFVGTYSVDQPVAPITVNVIDTSNHVGYSISCNGANDAAIFAFVTNGTAPFSYSWSNLETNDYLYMVGPDTYSVTVSDANNCVATADYTVTEPAVLTGIMSGSDVVCYGAADGTAGVVVSGGTPAYNYIWTNGETSASLANLGPDTYTVTVSDANACTFTDSQIVNEPAELVVAETVSDYNGYQVSCFGSSDGSVALSPTGGISPYSYLWNDGATVSSKSGLSTGSYSVTVSDMNQCEVILSYTFTSPLPVALSYSVSNVSCNGGSDGGVDMNILLGTGVSPFSFYWSNGATTEDLNNIPAGTYNVTITDDNGCTYTGSRTVTEPAELLASISIDSQNTFNGADVSCNGATDGVVTAVVSGGTTTLYGYSYLWDNDSENPATTASVSQLGAGIYNVTVTDAHGCVANATVTLVDPDPLSSTTLVTSSYGSQGTQTSCFTSADATAEVTATGGTGVLSYNWGTYGTGATIGGLPAGTTYVTITDENGCSHVDSVTVTPAPEILLDAHVTSDYSGSDVTCPGAADGSMEVIASGGIGTLTYMWSDNLGTSSTVSGVGAGTYYVTVTDENNCELVAMVTLTDPVALSVNVQVVSDYNGYDISCNGGSDGIVEAVVSGGSGSYSYVWNDQNSSTTQQVSGLPEGAYSVMVSDGNGCVASDYILIYDPEPVTLSATISDYNGFNVTCNGLNDGWINTVVAGGLSPYTYLWSNNNETTANVSNLPPGNHTVSVTDFNGCVNEFNFFLTQPDSIYGTFDNLSDYNGFNISCNGSADGTFNMNVMNGTAPFTYLWNNNATDEDLSALTAGTYDVTITDVIGCQGYGSVTLTEPALFEVASIVATSDYYGFNISCFGMTDGSADLTLSNGIAPFSYSWSNGSDVQNPANLPGGVSTVTVTDANGCEAIGSVTLTEPDEVAGTAVVSSNYNGAHVSCPGAVNGSIDLTVTAGFSPYTFMWSNNETTEDLNMVGAGTYDVTITDAHGCMGYASVTVVDPDPITYTADITNVDCNGNSTGTIDITPSGGTGNYSFYWNYPNNSEDAVNVPAGYYFFLIMDQNWCFEVSPLYQVTEPDVLLASASVTSDFDGFGVSCMGASDGSASLAVSGGTTPYSFVWDNQSTDQNPVNLPAGDYNVTVTDANLCEAYASVTITEPAGFSVVAMVTSDYNGYGISCNGGSDGTADVTTVNGFAPYTYSWSNGDATASVSGLMAGSYQLTVTDSHGCIASAEITLSEPSALSLNLAITSAYNGYDVSCSSATDGGIQSTVSGGYGQYSYLWSNGETTMDITNAPAGENTLTVSDENGCSVSASITLTAPDALVANAVVTSDYNGSQISCSGATDASFDLTVSGGLTPYTYAWDNGATTEDQSGVGSGVYTVTVSDVNGCDVITSVEVIDQGEIDINYTANDVTCFGANDGWISTTITGGTSPYYYFWNTGETTSEINNLAPGTYYMFALDANYCYSNTLVITVEEPMDTYMLLSGSMNPVDCNGGANGGVNITPNGGNQPYTYLWSTGSTGEDLVNVSAGQYTVTVWDNYECHSISQSFNVTEPTALLVTETLSDFNGYNISCNGAMDGSIDLAVSGGLTPYNYYWDYEGNSSSYLTNMFAGTYNVTVTDFNNCSFAGSYTLTQADVLAEASVTIINNVCYGDAMGSIDLIVSGGALPYSYSWSNNATDSINSGLVANTYDVTVSDVNNCQLTLSYTLTEGVQFFDNAVVTDVSCNGAADGSVVLTADGGQAPYTYAWSNGGTDASITGLSGGTFDLTVTDANSCAYIYSYSVNEPAALTLSSTFMDVTCNGASDGSVDLTVAGGIAPYAYSWDNGAVTEDLTSLSGGDYNVTVSDANQCFATLMVSVFEPDALVLAETMISPSCNGDADGSISVAVSGGVSPYYYSWSNGTTSNAINNLGDGTYSLTVTSLHMGAACVAIETYTLVEPDVLAFTSNVTNVTCNGGTDGMVELTVTGGTTPYSIDWNDGSTGAVLSNIGAGEYTVAISDVNGCAISSGSVVMPWTYNNTGVNHSVVITATPMINGTAITPGDYIGAFYMDSLGTAQCGGYIQYTGSVTGISLWGEDPAGADNGFENGESFMWKVWRAVDGVVVDLSATYNAFLPNQGTYMTNGLSEVTALSGTGPAIVPAGSGSFTVSEPDAIVLSESISDVSCFGAEDGSIDLVVTNAVDPVTYNWSNGATTAMNGNLAAGNYDVTVADANGCSVVGMYTVNEPAELTIAAVSSDVTCYGSNDGSIDVTVSGGTPNYSFAWSSSPSQAFNWTYTNTGTNHTVVISASTPVMLDGQALQNGDVIGVFYDYFGSLVCAGYQVWNGINTNVAVWGTEVDLGTGQSLNNGYAIGEEFKWKVWQASTGIVYDAVATYQIGFPDMQYYVTDGMSSMASLTGSPAYSSYSSGEDLINLAPGLYHLDVTDANGCMANAEIMISQPDPITIDASLSDFNGFNISSCGGNDGSISLSVSGGTGTYAYAWSTGNNTASVSGLTMGDYFVTVTDAASCTAVASYSLTEFCNPITIDCSASDANCFGSSNGSVSTLVGGGYGPFTYEWSNGATTAELAAVAAGTYSVTVTDIYGQTATCSSLVNQPAQILINFSLTHNDCYGETNGAIDLTVSGGSSPYNYVWTNSETTQDLTNLAADVYGCMVTDNHGCTLGFNIEILENDPIVVSGVATDASVYGASDGAVDITVAGGSGTFTYYWSNGATTEDLSGVMAGTYTVVVTDGLGCHVQSSFTVSQPAPQLPLEIVNLNSTPVTCAGDANGTVDLTVANGNGTITYTWDNGSTTEDLSGLSGGVYNVTVSDAINSVTAQVSVNESSVAISYNAIPVDALSCQPDGSIDLTVLGGTSPYSFTWNNGMVTEDIDNLPGGDYAVTITDAYGCVVSTSSYTVGSNNIEVTVSQITENVCYGDANASLMALVNGGSLPMTFNWSSGQNLAFISGLIAGTYDVTVTDANNCSAVASFDVIDPAELIVEIVANPIGLTANAVSGYTGTVTYLWDNGKPFKSIKNLTVGQIYCVTVTDENGCTGTACAEYTGGVFNPSKGVETNEFGMSVASDKFDFSLYPNPTTEGKFFVEMNTYEFNEAVIEVVDAYGQTIFTTHSGPETERVLVQLENASVGMYYVRVIVDNKGVVSKRLIIVK